MSDGALHYRSAGVDLDASDAAKARIGRLVESTRTGGAVGAFGGFGGMFKVPSGMRSPVLVSSADGEATIAYDGEQGSCSSGETIELGSASVECTEVGDGSADLIIIR